MKNRRLPLILVIVFLALLGVAALSSYRASALNDTPLGSDTTVSMLTSQLNSADPQTRADAATALSGLDDREATTALLANLGDTDPAAGYATAMALSHSDDPTVTDALVANLNSPETLIRQRAVLALSKMQAPEAVPALAFAMQDAAVSMGAAQALVNANTPEAQDALLVALADKELSTQRHAAMAAIENADPALSQIVLGRALASNDPVLVANATQLREFIGQ